jgi:hypothetical protein
MSFFYDAMMKIALSTNKKEIAIIRDEIKAFDDVDLLEKNLSFQELEILLNATKEQS